jgi:ribosomal protein S18 acetylase RimI-like enzyme
MEVIIRTAVKKDLGTIQDISKTVFEVDKSYDPTLDMDWPTSLKGVNYFRNAVSSPEYCKLIAVHEGIPVGYLLGAEFKYDYRKVKYGEIQSMGVKPDYRRLGVGSKLVGEFRKWSKSKGLDEIYVNTYYFDVRAVNFYKKHGYI